MPKWNPRRLRRLRPGGDRRFPPPRIERISAELQQEIDDVLGDGSLDELFSTHKAQATRGPEPEVDQRLRGAVVKVHRDDVFVSLPGGFEGTVPLKQFVDVPSKGEMIDVLVSGWNQEDGLYQLRVTGASVDVADWSDLQEGLVVEARITGHNTGGLEAEVNQIRGFIPVSQVALYRVEDLSQFVGEKMVCVVTEANPRRGNLVLSRRADPGTRTRGSSAGFAGRHRARTNSGRGGSEHP